MDYKKAYRDHAKFPPSTLERLIHCPASWIERETRPDQPPSKFALHGTMLHEYVPIAYKSSKSVVAELEDPEDRFMVLECIEYIEDITVTFPSVFDIEFEKVVKLANFDEDLHDVWGTADVIMFDHTNKHLHVVDWKFGKGVQVYANKNAQGIAYLIGAAALYPEVDKLTFHIFQPSLSHVDTYEMTMLEVYSFIEDKLKPAIADSQSATPTYRPSVQACRFCPAKVDCVARNRFNVDTAKEVFKMYNKLPKVSPEEIKGFLDRADELIEYINALKKHARKEILSGGTIPGYKLVNGRSHRKWANEKKAVQWLMDNTTLDSEDMFKTTLKGPGAIEKADRTLLKDDEFAALIIKPEGKLSLTKDTDKRESVTKSTEAAKVFGNLAEV